MLTCYFENGSKDSLRHVTVAVIIVNEGKILLARRGTFKGNPILESGKWGLPGGYLDRDENLVQGAMRESKEELGMEITNLRLMHIVDRPDRPGEDRQNLSFTYIADKVTDPQMVSEEVSEYRWFSLEDLPDAKLMAFDFYDELILYKKFVKQKLSLPVFG